MLPFDDITTFIPDQESTSISNDALNENLSQFQATIRSNQDELVTVNNFTSEYVDALQETGSALQNSNSMLESSLDSISNSLSSILDAQNDQLSFLRSNSQAIQAGEINSIDNTSQNSTSSTIQNQTSLESNFLTELNRIENMGNQSLNNSINSTSDNRTNESTLTVDQSNALSTIADLNQTFQQAQRNQTERAGLVVTNPLDQEMLAMMQNFSNVTNQNSNFSNSNSQTGAFQLSTNSLNSTINDIDSSMAVDRTEIENRVNQTSTSTNTSTENISNQLINSFSAALAQHDQRLIETVNSANSTSSKTENSTVISNNTNETNLGPNVQNNSNQGEVDRFNLETNMAAISTHLMTITSLLSSMQRNQYTKW